jgi:hypothetical protein
MSFVACNTLFLKGVEECGVTTFTKICANSVEDWRENVRAQFDPLARVKANPYGMVAYIPVSIFEGVEKIFIYQLGQYSDLWEINERGEGKIVIVKVRQSDLPTPFGKKEMRDAKALSVIYQHFEPKELNILASHRDMHKSKECMEYAFNAWSIEYEKVISLLESDAEETKIAKSIIRIANACKQIETKTDFILNGIPLLKNKIVEILPEVEDDDKTGGIILEEIYDHLSERAPLSSKRGNYENFFIALERQYKFNRENIIPLTNALVRYFENAYDYVSDHSLPSFEMKDKLRKIEKIMRELDDNSIIEMNTETEEIKPDLKNIRRAYGSLCKSEPELLKQFPRKGKRRELVDWNEVKDGSDETWSR